MGLKYYDDMKEAPLSDLLRQVIINTDNQLISFSDYSWQDFPDTEISTEAYIIFYQGGPIDHGTPIPLPFDESSKKSEYNISCTAGMDLENFRI